MKNILVIDDRLEILKIVESMLKGKEFIIYKASGGEKALLLSEKIKFDLVISDLRLNETTGIIILERIKKKQPEIKTILMSGSFFPDKEEIRKFGINAFLQKPFEGKELETIIRKVLNK